MEQKEQTQYFIPSIPVSFMVTVTDQFETSFYKRAYMPAVPRAGDRLRLLVNNGEYWFIVEKVEYVEEPEKSYYEVDLEDIPNREETLNDLYKDPYWH